MTHFSERLQVGKTRAQQGLDSALRKRDEYRRLLSEESYVERQFNQARLADVNRRIADFIQFLNQPYP